jgi:hypothetical protein
MVTVLYWGCLWRCAGPTNFEELMRAAVTKWYGHHLKAREGRSWVSVERSFSTCCQVTPSER